jgi:hypothetical protein
MEEYAIRTCILDLTVVAPDLMQRNRGWPVKR